MDDGAGDVGVFVPVDSASLYVGEAMMQKALASPSVEVVTTAAEKVLENLSPASMLDEMAMKVVECLRGQLRGMTVDQRIRILGHLVQMYKKEGGGGVVNVQIVNSMPAPR